MRTISFWRIVSLSIIVCIFIATLSPGATGHSTRSMIQQVISVEATTASLLNFILRKSVHILTYGTLAFSFYHSFVVSRYVKALTLTIAVATIDETIQYFVPDRTGQLKDIILDSSSAFLVLLIIYIIQHKKDLHRS